MAVDMEALYRGLYDDVFRFMLKHVATFEDAEELSQQTFLKACEAAPRYEDRGLPVEAWLWRIARNLLTDHYRLKRHRSVPLGVVEDLAGMADPTPGPDAHLDLLDVAPLIDRLNRRQRAVLLARVVVGLSERETADLIGTSVNGVKKVKSRALGNLRSMLGEAVA